MACCANLGGQTSTPSWLQDSRGFCQELAKRANGPGPPVPFGKPRLANFSDYPARALAPPRAEQGFLGNYDWKDRRVFAEAVREEISKGPDFAGKFAILTWSCGTWCRNATIADIRTGKTYDTPFVGIIGCDKITGNFDTLQRQADISLLIARGSLELAFGHYFDEGPCGTY